MLPPPPGHKYPSVNARELLSWMYIRFQLQPGHCPLHIMSFEVSLRS